MNKELEQAFNVVAQVCAQFKGNMDEHNLIQKALDLLKKELFKEKEKGGEDEFK